MKRIKILRWKQYTARPYKVNEQPENFTDFTYKEELWILESEVRRALDQCLTKKKAPGCDNTKIKILKAIKEDITPAITNLCNEVWKKVKWPSEWKLCIF